MLFVQDDLGKQYERLMGYRSFSQNGRSILIGKLHYPFSEGWGSARNYFSLIIILIWIYCKIIQIKTYYNNRSKWFKHYNFLGIKSFIKKIQILKVNRYDKVKLFGFKEKEKFKNRVSLTITCLILV